ncbi:MAG: hypothetical protein KBD78_01600 [Oligoflexales bacterium]|nr:hypothetical protein [Oligoflexales bacterium]
MVNGGTAKVVVPEMANGKMTIMNFKVSFFIQAPLCHLVDCAMQHRLQ